MWHRHLHIGQPICQFSRTGKFTKMHVLGSFWPALFFLTLCHLHPRFFPNSSVGHSRFSLSIMGPFSIQLFLPFPYGLYLTLLRPQLELQWDLCSTLCIVLSLDKPSTRSNSVTLSNLLNFSGMFPQSWKKGRLH